MVQETGRGIPYPEEFDHTRVWEHFEAMALGIDAMLSAVPSGLWGGTRRPIIDFGVVTMPAVSNASSASIVITFPRPFASNPTVIVTCQQQPIAFLYGARGVSRTGATLYTSRRDSGTGNNNALPTGWLAIGVPAT